VKPTLLRVLRVVRIVRVARIIRVMRFFRELRMMLFAILNSFKSLMWVILVLGVVFYIFGISFTAATTSYLETAEMWNAQENKYLILYFGSLSDAMLSLFMSMTGGNDWAQYYDALETLPFHNQMLFVLFIMFSFFAVVNVVTGIFVESAMQSGSKDRQIIINEEMSSKQAYLEEMRDLFNEMDSDSTGLITLEEFERSLNDEKVIAYFNHLKLDVSDARILFQLLDFDQSDQIAINEFVYGCYKFQGESRALDVKIMEYEVKFLKEMVVGFSRTLNDMRNELVEANHLS
jgi:hypothetical protein